MQQYAIAGEREVNAVASNINCKRYATPKRITAANERNSSQRAH